MSSFDPAALRERRWFLTGVSTSCGLIALSGCGFRPLYGRRAETGQSTLDALSRIYISPLEDRTGQQLQNLLSERLNPRGRRGNALYALQVRLRETTRELALRSDQTATRAELRLTAEFVLRRRADQKRLTGGTSFSANSYNILESQFATQVSEQDARERGLREVSDDIKIRLAAHFDQPLDPDREE
ncbi:MAG: LPS assembly lipoprotein LptE [Kiloniellales bacterium]|nr:LPS assembly lipoprotein LptE [Kiloniellales bacterium]